MFGLMVNSQRKCVFCKDVPIPLEKDLNEKSSLITLVIFGWFQIQIGWKDIFVQTVYKMDTIFSQKSLRWRHNGRDSVSNHQPHDCLLKRLFRRRSKKISKLRATGLCAGNSPGTGEFPAQMASNAENISIWWRHYVFAMLYCIPLSSMACDNATRVCEKSIDFLG